MHNCSLVVSFFLSNIFLYLSSLLFIFNPCQGKFPLKKYMRTYPTDSKSSLRLCSISSSAWMDAYLAVPVNFFFFIYGYCSKVFEERYFFAKPKSNKNKSAFCLFNPITKLSGFISLCIICLSWIYCKTVIIWYANNAVVFTENFCLLLNNSSKLLPINCITNIL